MQQKNLFILDAIIFDLDGTLIDSIGIYFNSLETTFNELGLPLPSRKAVSDAVNEGSFNWDHVLPDADRAQKDAWIAAAEPVIRASMGAQEIELVPGADRVLKEIIASNMKTGIVTSSFKKYMPDKLYPLEKAGIDGFFEAIITIDDVGIKKPAPDPLIECAKRLGADAEKCAYVGDSRMDIKAGRAAGMKTIGVLTGLDDRDTLMLETPDVIIESVSDLKDVVIITAK